MFEIYTSKQNDSPVASVGLEARLGHRKKKKAPNWLSARPSQVGYLAVLLTVGLIMPRHTLAAVTSCDAGYYI